MTTALRANDGRRFAANDERRKRRNDENDEMPTTMKMSLFIASILFFPAFVIAAEGGPSLPAQPASSLPPGAASSFRSGGFYHVETINGVDWVIDPAGRAMMIRGIDHVRPMGWKDRDLGYDVYARFVETNYPSKADWVDETLGRLCDWGFNTLANHCDEPLLRRRGLAHTITLYLGGKFGAAGGPDPDRWITPWSGPCTGLPNVFHPVFETEVREAAARLCAPEKDDPWLLGWFLDNELKWWGADTARKDLTLFDAVRALPENHTARRALEAFAAGRPVDNALREDFLRLFAERYFSVLCSAIREADPNHMILGCRFAGPFAQVHPALWEVAGRHCDIVSFNCYPWADIDRGVVLDGKGGRPVAERFAEIHGWCSRPLMVTEFAFPALDAGRPCFHGAGQRFPTQEGRAAATALFVCTMLSLPYFAGYSYFMFLDQPASGIAEDFPEDSNYGLINEFGVPYPEITAAFRDLHANLDAARSAPTPGAGVGVGHSTPPAPSERERYFAEVANLANDANAVGFRQETDGSWTLSNSLVRLSGRVGGAFMADEIAFSKGGADSPSEPQPPAAGRFRALLQWQDGEKSVWTDTTRVTDVSFSRDDATGIVTATVRSEGGSADTGEQKAPAESVAADAPSAAGNALFAVTARLSLAPGRADVLGEIVSAENLSSGPLRVECVFMRPYAAEARPKEVDSVPNLWKGPLEDWWALSDGRRFGLSSRDDALVSVSLWIKDGGVQHPDARFGAPFEIAPGETWRPADPMGALLRCE